MLLALAGCGGGAAVDRTPAPAPCETLVRAEHPADTVTIVLFDTVDLSHAPWGRNREERFVFSHLYETLVTINCRDEARTGPLTKSVVEASDGWLIELREDARFWDDTPVTARAVQMSLDPSLGTRDGLLRVDVIDEHSLIVHGRDGRLDIKILALPMYSVTKHHPASNIPIGTGDWVIDESVPAAEAIVIQPASGESPVVRFVQGNVSDARDIMDGSADAMITDDPAAMEYARSKDKVAMAPLAWDRAYVFISPTRLGTRPGNVPTPKLPLSMTAALARDVVEVDARGGVPMLTWLESVPAEFKFLKTGVVLIGGTDTSTRASNSMSLSRRLLYVNSDRTARSLAERIVAIAAMDRSSVPDARALAISVPNLRADLQATGLSDLATALEEGRDFGYVMSLWQDGDFPFVGRSFMDNKWISSPGGQLLTDAILPLVETRAHFVAISDRIGFVDDHSGNVRVMIHTAERRH